MYIKALIAQLIQCWRIDLDKILLTVTTRQFPIDMKLNYNYSKFVKKIINFLLIAGFLLNINITFAKDSPYSQEVLDIYKIEDRIVRLNKIRDVIDKIEDSQKINDFLAEIDLYRTNWGLPNLQWFYFPFDLINSQEGKTLLSMAFDNGLNTVVIDAENFGRMVYDSKFRQVDIKTMDDIEFIKNKISFLKSNWIYTIARIMVLKNKKLAKRYPLLTRNNRQYDRYWVDWSNKEVLKHFKQVVYWIEELWFDEIQLDYIRFPTEWLHVQKEQDWLKRINTITTFVKEIYKETQKLDIKLSIDTFGIVSWNSNRDTETTGQDLKQLIKHIDYLCPMIYPSHFNQWFWWFHDYSNPYSMVSAANQKLIDLVWIQYKWKIRPWLQWFNFKSPLFWPKYIYNQIKASKDLWLNNYLIKKQEYKL